MKLCREQLVQYKEEEKAECSDRVSGGDLLHHKLGQ